MEWLRRQWNEPNRTEFYLMRIAQRVQQLYHSQAGIRRGVSIKEQKIELDFDTPAEESSKPNTGSRDFWVAYHKHAARRIEAKQQGISPSSES